MMHLWHYRILQHGYSFMTVSVTLLGLPHDVTFTRCNCGKVWRS